ncbi:Uncharacterised protein [Bordetella ansorpii]|uniref:Uncharacterized protein n=1 Tax=Bordetella ansorpii TaxID=288768 RepID=A0A157SRX5_9BORD|nr:hypothetical protein [Bordetella ansorpii]SAI73169.1 Uncharacterised protein [Bordetella ansorpii]
MNQTELNQLARRLEGADALSNSERVALLNDVERAARHDLYGATQLWRDHVPKDADLRMPQVLAVAEVVHKRFEGRADQERAPIALYSERDTEVGRPESGREYRGPIVGFTPDYAVQRAENGDYILHGRRGLTGATQELGRDDVSIRYPFSPRGVGLVQRIEPATEHDRAAMRLEKPHETAMEHAR